jgi:hypothetical protein
LAGERLLHQVRDGYPVEARGGCKSGCALQGKHWKPNILVPGTLRRTWGTQRFAYYRGAGGSVRFKRLMRPKPPHRGLRSLRLGTRRWKTVHARLRCDG